MESYKRHPILAFVPLPSIACPPRRLCIPAGFWAPTCGRSPQRGDARPRNASGIPSASTPRRRGTTTAIWARASGSRYFGLAAALAGAAAIGACTAREFDEPGRGGAESEGEAFAPARCTEDRIEELGDDGAFETVGRCDSECEPSGEGCAKPCEPDALRCRDGRREACDAETGAWIFAGTRAMAACGSNYTCVDQRGAAVCVERVCQPNAPFCELDGRGTRVCNEDGSDSAPVERCTEVQECVGGLCRDACDAAAEMRSFIGCEYVWFDTNNNAINDPYQDGVFLANAHETAAVTVTVEERRGGEWAPYGAPVTVQPGGDAYIRLTCNASCGGGNIGPDRHGEDTGVFRQRAMRVTSNYPIAAWHVNSDDQSGAASSSTVSIMFPTSALEKQHYALTAPENITDQNEAGRGWVAVAAFQEDTVVAIRASAPTVRSGGDSDEPIEPLVPGGSWMGVLQPGDVVQIASGAMGADLSGSLVESDKPVAVFAGHECYAYPGRGGICLHRQGGTGDGIAEMMPPVVAWGKVFVAARVQHSNYREIADNLWKVVASEDDTTVTFSSDRPWAGLPAEPVRLQAAGDVWQARITADPGVNSGHFRFEADNPVSAVQIIGGESAMVLVVPTEQYLPEYTFVAPPFFPDNLAITKRQATSVLLDGAPVIASWVPIGDWEVAWIDSVQDQAHRVAMMDENCEGGDCYPQIQMVGMDYDCSYGYLGGLNVEWINPIQ